MKPERICKDCRWLGDCQRNDGADPYDPACTGFVSAVTDPALWQVLGDALKAASAEDAAQAHKRHIDQRTERIANRMGATFSASDAELIRAFLDRYAGLLGAREAKAALARIEAFGRDPQGLDGEATKAGIAPTTASYLREEG